MCNFQITRINKRIKKLTSILKPEKEKKKQRKTYEKYTQIIRNYNGENRLKSLIKRQIL